MNIFHTKEKVMKRMKWEMLKLGKGNNAKIYKNEKKQKRATGNFKICI